MCYGATGASDDGAFFCYRSRRKRWGNVEEIYGCPCTTMTAPNWINAGNGASQVSDFPPDKSSSGLSVVNPCPRPPAPNPKNKGASPFPRPPQLEVAVEGLQQPTGPREPDYDYSIRQRIGGGGSAEGAKGTVCAGALSCHCRAVLCVGLHGHQ
jgi:hypothetical protein